MNTHQGVASSVSCAEQSIGVPGVRELSNAMNPGSNLAVVICTYNRSHSLIETLASLYADGYAGPAPIDIVVVANNCSDDTLAQLSQFRSAHSQAYLRLSWLEEPKAGKSYALNTAIAHTHHDVLCFIDDDQVVEPGFFAHLVDGIERYPQDDIFCGRIWPAWDGSEPSWVHAKEPYAIPIRPFPEFDLGTKSIRLNAGDRSPSGGNITVRRRVFDVVGAFSIDLGPIGHNLAGGEDHDFLKRAALHGYTTRYLSHVRQLHAIDAERMSTPYILRKSYSRSRSNFLVHSQETLPRLYMFRKVLSYLGSAVFSRDHNRRFFYLVRLAASTGELSGAFELTWAAALNPLRAGFRRLIRNTAVAKPVSATNEQASIDTGKMAPGIAPLALALGMATASAIVSSPSQVLLEGTLSAALAAILFTLALLVKSIIGFSRTGPSLKQEIQEHYARYSLFAFARLAAWALLIGGLMAAAGVAVYSSLNRITGFEFTTTGAVIAAFGGIGAVTSLQFCRHLLYLPATIAASSHYRLSRLYPLWRRLSPGRLQIFQWTLALAAALVVIADLTDMLTQRHWVRLAAWGILAGAVAAVVWALSPGDETLPTGGGAATDPARPNIVMIGSDTLRADRVGNGEHHRELTPYLNALAACGTHFTHCYVPCARTAPSLISLLTGTWPHTHGVRDNFIGDDQLDLPVPALPALLAKAGYMTAAIGDWAAADMGKFKLGFEQRDLSEDQWNIKYLIRQGPKDLRLFLSLFTHNGFGKRFLPEIYYLGGIPLTREIGRDARAMISDLAAKEQPFFLNVFMATTHPPFGSEYPYYTLYSDPAYRGESKFVMARLTDPFEIIRRQGDSKKEFDLDQIIDLYDGCVKSFDDEVARIVAHIKTCGLEQNTVIVIYSDHGMEFFEHETWGQGNSVMGDHSAHVPLIIKDPRKPPGGTVSRITRSVDLAPTLLDLLGMEQPPEMDGVSLAPYMENRDIDLGLTAHNETGIWLTTPPGMPPDHLHYPDLPDLLEVPDKRNGTLAIKPEYQKIIVSAKDRMIRTERWKLTYQPMRNGEIYKLFDLLNDPGCYSNVLDLHPEVAEDLRQKLRAWMEVDLAIAIRAEGKSGTTG
ncbi:MAG: sulfatase-like hydrolase/transferase [Gammaproteobacteria bacterium]